MDSKAVKKTIMIGVLGLATAIAGVGLASYLSPWLVLKQARAALAAGDEGAVNALVDWESIRKELTKNWALGVLSKEGIKPGDERVQAVVLGVENMVGVLVTQQNLLKILEQANMSGSQFVVKGVYLNMGTYVFAIKNKESQSAVSLRLRRLGPLSWKIDELIVIDPRALAQKR